MYTYKQIADNQKMFKNEIVFFLQSENRKIAKDVLEIKSEDEFHGKSYKDRVLVAEGVEGLVPVRGNVKELVDQAIGGIRSGMYYVGTRNIAELQEKGKFMQITQASLVESHPHDLLVTNGGENYI